MNARFIRVEPWAVAWENASSGRSLCAILITVLMDLYAARNKLKIAEQDGYMALSVDYISTSMENSLADRTISRTLKILENENVIEQVVSHNGRLIKLNIDFISAIKERYAVENYNTKFFTVYYFVLAFAQENYPRCTMFPYMASRFIQEVENGSFAKYMSRSFIHNKFCEVFSNKQERVALDVMIRSGLLIRECNNRVTDSGIRTDRYLIICVEKVEEILRAHSFMAKEATQQYHFIGSHHSLDGVSSESYTAEELEQIRKNANWIDEMDDDYNDPDLPF